MFFILFSPKGIKRYVVARTRDVAGTESIKQSFTNADHKF